MKISTKGRYAVRVMLDLAMHNTGEYIKVKQIAERQGISEKYLEQIIALLNKGGCLAWGLIPTTGEDLKAEGAASLKEKFWKGIQRLARQGVNEGLLARQYLLTPSCGTGTLSVAQCSQVYSLTFDLQKLLQGHPG